MMIAYIALMSVAVACHPTKTHHHKNSRSVKNCIFVWLLALVDFVHFGGKSISLFSNIFSGESKSGLSIGNY